MDPVWADVGGDPVPVESGGLHAILNIFSGTAESASGIRGSLGGISGQAGAQAWSGEAADAFREKLGDLPGMLEKVEVSYRDAAVAVAVFVAVVERARVEADALVGPLWAAFDGQRVAHAGDPAAPDAPARVDAAERAVRDVRARVDAVRVEYQRAEAVVVAALAVARDAAIEPDSPWHRFLREVEHWAGVIVVVLLVIVVVALVVLVTVFTLGGGMALFAALLLALETLGPALTALTVFSAAKLAATATRKAQYNDEDTPSWTAIGIEAALILIPIGLGKAASVLRGARATESAVLGSRAVTEAAEGTAGATRLVEEAGEAGTVVDDVATGVNTLRHQELTEFAQVEARQLVSRAMAEEPAVTASLERAAGGNGSRLVGLENKLKTEASLTRKMADLSLDLADDIPADQAVRSVSSNIKDVLRYTVESDTGNYAAAYERTVQDLESQGFTRLASKNTWAEPGSPLAGPYRGINESWRTAEGQVFEVQFHTPESFATKMATHDMYGEVRSVDVSPERTAELIRIMTEMSDRIPVPRGAVPGN
jgi:hypothetical protein